MAGASLVNCAIFSDKFVALTSISRRASMGMVQSRNVPVMLGQAKYCSGFVTQVAWFGHRY